MRSNRPTDLTLWRWWFLVTVIGFVIGGILGAVGAIAGFYSIGEALLQIGVCQRDQGAMFCLFMGGILGAAITFGISVGVAQRVVLKRWVSRSWWWVSASALGWAGIALTLVNLSYTPIAGPVGQPDGTFVQTNVMDNLAQVLPAAAWVILSGALMGLFQGLVLQPRLRRWYLWAIAHVLMMVAAALVIIFWLQGSGGMVGLGFQIIVTGPLYAAITGLFLMHITASETGSSFAEPTR